MRFLLKTKLSEFHKAKDLLKFIRKKAGRSDIHKEDIGMIRIFEEAKCVVILVESKPQKGKIEIYQNIAKA